MELKLAEVLFPRFKKYENQTQIRLNIILLILVILKSYQILSHRPFRKSKPKYQSIWWNCRFDGWCSLFERTTIRINKQDYPQEIVKSRFLEIGSMHIEYIYMSFKENTSNVQNNRAFLITTIFRAFETADNWYAAKVNYDIT